MRTGVTRFCVGLASICCILLFTLDVQAAGEDKAIAKLIQSVSHAMVDLPKTKNVKAVLQYFAGDYTFLEDG